MAEKTDFGVPRNQIDQERVRLAVAQAQIFSFIEARAKGYVSFEGERCILLTGGQRHCSSSLQIGQ